MSKKISGHKDLSSKVIFVVTGLCVLIGLNALFIIRVKYPSWKWWWLIGLTLLGWIFRRMWRIQTKLKYVFDDDGVSIYLPSGKAYLLKKKHIKNMEHIDTLPRWSGRGIKYLPWNKELHFTTSSSHLLRITMDDGRVIIISPKTYPHEKKK